MRKQHLKSEKKSYMREEETQLREREEYALLPQRLSIGPDSGAPCSPWAKGGGLFCHPCLEEMESEHIPH